MKPYFLLFLLLIIMVGLRPFPTTAAPQATIVVNSLADDQTVNGNCTLREALLAADNNTAQDGCAAGSAAEPDLIVFAVTVNGVIYMALGEFVITSPVIIQGNGRDETIIDAYGNSRIFRAENYEPYLKLESLTLQNGGYNTILLDQEGAQSPELHLDNVVIQDSAGSAIDATHSHLTIKNSLLQRNGPSYHGGAIRLHGSTAIIEDSIMRGNSAEEFGGAIFGIFSSLQITRTLFEDNIGRVGGGLLLQASSYSLTITDSTIRNNIANGDGDGGGGIHVMNTNVFIEGSTISGNRAVQGSGGGILFDIKGDYSTPTFLMTNSTISGNTAFLGGGLYLNTAGDSATNIYHTTIANNTALSGLAAGGAIFLEPNSNPVFLRRSIISGNSGFPTCYPFGYLNSVSFSLLQDNSCGSHPTDVVGVDPLLGPLADNGGPTETHALLPDSPAIDLANCIPGIAVDQRGVMRPQGARCDSGAFEFEDLAVYLPLVVRTP